MKCKKCGNQILENEQYCRNCGESINVLDSQSNFSQPANNINSKYKLTIIRKKAFAGWAATFNIYIDNVLVGKIKNGQKIDLEITGGDHQISINQNNPVNITITGDIVVEAVVFGVNNYGIVVNGQSNINTSEFITKNRNSTNFLFWSSIFLTISSTILFLLWRYYITYWIYAVIIGLAIINIAGLKNQRNNAQYKELMIKNIMAIIISTVILLITIYFTVFL